MQDAMRDNLISASRSERVTRLSAVWLLAAAACVQAAGSPLSNVAVPAADATERKRAPGTWRLGG